MRLGIDCRTILQPDVGEQTGIGNYTFYLVKNLLALDKKNDYVLFFDNRFKATKDFEQPNVVIRHFPFLQYRKYLPIAYSQMLVSAVLNRENLDVFHSPSSTIPLLYNRPAVITIHDLAIYKHPEFFPHQLLSREIFATKTWIPYSAAKAKKIIAISNNTKIDIIEELEVPADKIDVVYHGVISHGKSCPNQSDHDQLKKKFNIKDNYILFLGTLEPRKNIVGLIKAYRDMYLTANSPLKDFQLIIAGAPGWRHNLVYQAIADANNSILGQSIETSDQKKKIKIKKESDVALDRDLPIKYIGYVSHADKLSLICCAGCFVFPSFYEGFGLPILEAMSMGTPVITSKVSALPEIVGEGSAILIDPNKEIEISEALVRILSDAGLRESLSVSGQQRAKKFTWQECAEKTLAVYQSIYRP